MSLIRYIKGDLFNAPKGAVLTHSCNCQGSWGGGVAAIFHKKFPVSYETYKNHCAQYSAEELLGTCLVIPTSGSEPGGAGYKIACLFTSNSGGGGADPPAKILTNTDRAMHHLITQLEPSEEIHMPKINAGIFRVPWEDTEQVLRTLNKQIVVYEV